MKNTYLNNDKDYMVIEFRKYFYFILRQKKSTFSKVVQSWCIMVE